MTASAFSRSFRRHTGMGVVEYVNRLRINLACQMLMNEPGRVGDGHLLCGGLQQPVEFQPPVPATKGDAAQPVPRAARDNRPLAA
jgi:methylphosphotriester-DNA--protein-cysteine methyltransferase